MQKLVTFSCKAAPVALLFILAAGCVGRSYRDLPAGTRVEACPVVVERQEIDLARAKTDPVPAADYVIGCNDVLFVSIDGKPEFSTIGTSTATKVQGNRVDGEGNVHLPLIGSVNVAGLTVSAAQTRIEAAARQYLTNPWVVVEIADYKSRPLYLLGQFKAPGTYYMDRPLNLLQGVALGNGFDTAANLHGARLTRNNHIVAVDIYDLLTRGDTTQNVWLQPGDTIYIPDNQNRLVFVYGAVKKPGPVPMPTAGLNLAQAIGATDLRDTGYDIHYVRIIRSLSPTHGELLVVDFDKVMRGEAVPPPLMDGDVVYVPKSVYGDWNDAIADLLPSLQAVSALLQPFVNIKFLSQ